MVWQFYGVVSTVWTASVQGSGIHCVAGLEFGIQDSDYDVAVLRCGV